MRNVKEIMLVWVPPLETLPLARMRRSEARRRATLTDEWDPDVSDRLLENEFFYFAEMIK